MDLVIDTSAILAVLLNESSKQSILDVTKGKTLMAPISIDAEIGNAISAMFKRSRINLETAKEIIQQYELIPIRKTTLELNEAIELSKELDIYAYDAYMLNCCKKYMAPLLSLDHTLLNQAKEIGLKTLDL